MTNTFSFNIYMEILVKKRTRSFSSYKALSFSFHGKNFTPTAGTLESKIEEVFKPFFGTCRGLWTTKAAWIDLPIWIAKKVGKIVLSIRNFEFKLNACVTRCSAFKQ